MLSARTLNLFVVVVARLLRELVAGFACVVLFDPEPWFQLKVVGANFILLRFCNKKGTVRKTCEGVLDDVTIIDCM